MQLSVVILNYNVRWFLQQCLDSVTKAIAGLDAEIIVVDNASPDDSCAMVRENFPNVILLENNENSGFPKGNNIGVARAKGELICILNPDTVVAEDTFVKAIEFYNQQENPGIDGVKLIDGRGNFLPESKRGVPTPWVAFTKVAGLYKFSKRFGRYYASHLDENQSGEVEILVGAFMLMKRDLYLEVGGFDENCFMYSDDIDLSYTVLKSGRKNYYFAGTSVIHYKGESTVKDQKYMMRFREAMDFFYKKHFRKSVLFDVFMKTGAYFFSVFKKNQSGEKPVVTNYRLFSDDETLVRKLRKMTGKSVDFQASTVSADFPQSSGTEIIFDSNHVNYRQIISFMESNRQSAFTYKIFHKSAQFAVGSDSSNDRGEVLRLVD